MSCDGPAWINKASLSLSRHDQFKHALQTFTKTAKKQQKNLIGKKCNATVYKGHWGEVGLLGNTFHIHGIPQIGDISFSSKKKKRKNKKNGEKK